MDSLSWKERLVMLSLAVPLIVAMTLMAMPQIYRYAKDDQACGVECRDDVQAVIEAFRQHHGDTNSCLAEFAECVRLIDEQ